MGVGGGWGTLKRVRGLLQSVLPMPRRGVWRLGAAAAEGCDGVLGVGSEVVSWERIGVVGLRCGDGQGWVDRRLGVTHACLDVEVWLGWCKGALLDLLGTSRRDTG
ncbi:hypothetical protein PIB30_048632 [Stylosanthes scabra]|uniref:Uncharacterized protein n=1 Tax=Stylosanthes scabra TaxID=79078 RepID=A0ABU6UHG2_9FABA|nr:hypothetical protein [Stylosanthes scabra]